MKTGLFVMPTVAATFEERERERPVGRSADRYQQMVNEVRELAVMADEVGVDMFGFTEHHFHTEGLEAMPNPMMLCTDLAARTRQISLMPMSIVLTATNPIRAAEDVALLDHFSGGRSAVCLARGYQKRWVGTLSQGAAAAAHQSVDSDAANRERFNEYAEIMLHAWTEDAFDFKGKYFEIPFPHSEGISGAPEVEWTRKFGADGEIDENGVIRKLGVVPKPLQQPHPPVFIPFTASPATLDFALEHEFTPMVLQAGDQFVDVCKLIKEKAAAFGRVQRLGQRVAATRGISIGRTEEEAFELCASTTGYEFQYYWNLFGFAEVFRDPAKDDPDKPVTFKDEYECARRIIDQKWQLSGTVDQVKRQMEELYVCHGDGQLDWLIWEFFYQGIHSQDVQRRQLELFTTQILPEFQ